MKYHVLFITDSICVEGIFQYIFEKAGYVFHSTRNGLDAWEKLENGLECDVIWCCTELPKMDILELFNILKKDPRFANIPVFALANRHGRHKYNTLVRQMIGENRFFIKPPLDELVIEATGEAIIGLG